MCNLLRFLNLCILCLLKLICVTRGGVGIAYFNMATWGVASLLLLSNTAQRSLTNQDEPGECAHADEKNLLVFDVGFLGF